jgi:hypothetical protein
MVSWIVGEGKGAPVWNFPSLWAHLQNPDLLKHGIPRHPATAVVPPLPLLWTSSLASIVQYRKQLFLLELRLREALGPFSAEGFPAHWPLLFGPLGPQPSV